MKIAMAGNCQAVMAARLIDAATPSEISCRGVELRPSMSAADMRWIADADVVFQNTHETGRRLNVQTRGRVLRLPMAGARFLWPFESAGHPRNDETAIAWQPGGWFNGIVVDEHLRRLIIEHKVEPDASQAQVDDLISEYLELDYTKLVDLDQLLARDREIAARIGGPLGAQVWSVLERDFRSMPVVYSKGQACRRLMQVLCCSVAAEIGIPITQERIDLEWFRMFQGDDPPCFSAPIHPSVARHFGMQWLGDTPKFRWYYDGFLTMGEIAERAIRLQRDRYSPFVFKAEQNLDEGLRKLTARLAEAHASPFFRLRYGLLLRRAGREPEALSHFIEAARLMPAQAGDAQLDVTRHLVDGFRADARFAVPGRSEMEQVGIGVPVTFTTGSPGTRLLYDGFYTSEVSGTWVKGYSGRLQFRLAPAPKGERVRMLFSVVGYAGDEPTQSVEVFVNGRTSGKWTFATRQTLQREAIVPGDAIEDGALDVVFYVSDPRRPASDATGDQRLLGLRLVEMMLYAG